MDFLDAVMSAKPSETHSCNQRHDWPSAQCTGGASSYVPAHVPQASILCSSEAI